MRARSVITRSAIRDVYDAAGLPCENAEERFFNRLRMPNGVLKTTEPHRLDDLNRLVEELLPDDRPLDLMDVAISSGITTRDWSQQLTVAGVAHRLLAGDSHISGAWVPFGLGDVLLDQQRRHVLYADIVGRSVDVSGDSTRSLLAIRVLKVFARLFWSNARDVELVSPRLRDCPAIEVVQDDIFASREDLVGRFHALRAANILNRGYFDDGCIRTAVANLRERLHSDGLLIVCRTHEDGTNHGTVFRLTDGQWTRAARIGNGSEIEDLVLAPTK
jgi:hypothetical protein